LTIHGTASFAVREDELDAALEAIRTFVAHTRIEPGTLRYESWRSAERPTEFTHLMSSSTRPPSTPTRRAMLSRRSSARCIRVASENRHSPDGRSSSERRFL
jgi:hypothetical protein